MTAATDTETVGLTEAELMHAMDSIVSRKNFARAKTETMAGTVLNHHAFSFAVAAAGQIFESIRQTGEAKTALTALSKQLDQIRQLPPGHSEKPSKHCISEVFTFNYGTTPARLEAVVNKGNADKRIAWNLENERTHKIFQDACNQHGLDALFMVAEKRLAFASARDRQLDLMRVRFAITTCQALKFIKAAFERHAQDFEALGRLQERRHLTQSTRNSEGGKVISMARRSSKSRS